MVEFYESSEMNRSCLDVAAQLDSHLNSGCVQSVFALQHRAVFRETIFIFFLLCLSFPLTSVPCVCQGQGNSGPAPSPTHFSTFLECWGLLGIFLHFCYNLLHVILELEFFALYKFFWGGDKESLIHIFVAFFF